MDAILNDENVKATLQNGLDGDMVKNRDNETVKNLDNDIVKNPKTSELKVHFQKSTKENGNEEEKVANYRTNLVEDDKINCVEKSSDDHPDLEKEDGGLCAIDLIEAIDHFSKAGDVEDEDRSPPVLQKVMLEYDKASNEDPVRSSETVDGKNIDVLIKKGVDKEKRNINGGPEKQKDVLMRDDKNCVEIESEFESDNSVELNDDQTKNGKRVGLNVKNTIDLQESFTSHDDSDFVEIVSDQSFDTDNNADSDLKSNDKSQPSVENLVREKSVIECSKKRGNGEHLDKKCNTKHNSDQVNCDKEESVQDEEKETPSSENRSEPSDQNSFTVFEVGDSDNNNSVDNKEQSSASKGAKNVSMVFEYRKDKEEFTVVAVDDEDDNVAEMNLTKSMESSLNESGLSTESCTAKELQDNVKCSPDVAVDEKKDEVDISKASEVISAVEFASNVVAATTSTAPATSSASKVGAKNVDPLSFLPKHEALINNIFLKPVTCEMAKCLVGIGLDMVREQVYSDTIKQVKTSNLPLTNSEKDSLKIVAEMHANVLKRIKYFKHAKKACGCGFKSESRNVLALHREYGNSIDDLSFVCCLCTFRFRNSYSFFKHMNQLHRMSGRARPKLSKFSCSLCSYENQSQSSFFVHESKCKRQFNLCVNLLFSRTDCDIPLYAQAKPGELKIVTSLTTKPSVTTASQVLKNLSLAATSKQIQSNLNLPSPTVPLLTCPVNTLRPPLPIISSMSSFQSFMNPSTLAGLNSTSMPQPRFIQLGDRLYAPVVQPSGQILLTPLSLPTAPVNPLPPIPQFNSTLFNSLNKTNIPPISLDMEGFLHFEQQMKASQGMRPIGQSLQIGGQPGMQVGSSTMQISSPSMWSGGQSMQMSSRSMRPVGRPVGQPMQLNSTSLPLSRQTLRPVIPTQNRAGRPPALSRAAVPQVATRQVRPTRQIPPLVRAPATNTNTRAPTNTKAPIRAAHNSRQIVIQPIADKQSTNTVYHVPAPPNYLICELCNGFVKDREALETHVRLVHKLSQDILNRVGEVCDLCLKKFYTRHGLLRHLRGDHSEDVLLIRPLAHCLLCNSKSESDLVWHMSSKHQNMMAALLDAVRCSICFLKMRNQMEFENHMLTVHKEFFPERVVLLACIAASASKFLPDKTYPIDLNDVIPVVVIAPDNEDEPVEVSPITITPKIFTKHETKKPEFKKLESSGGTGIIKPCYRCDASFPSLSKLQQHFHSVHRSEKEQCTMCSEHIQIGRPYVRHVRARHLRECSVVLQRLKGYSDLQPAENANGKKRRKRCKQFRNNSFLNDSSLIDEECSSPKMMKLDDTIIQIP